MTPNDINDKKIFVTKPYLPDLDEVIPYLEKIWETKWLTNNGQFHNQLERELAEFLDVPYLSLFANGTLALITALQALRITGEVITTPFTFIATTHALFWKNIRPVFVDIDPVYCNIDPFKIESAITNKTTAILPVHVYGNPCNHEKIQEIANIYGLKVVYDAAHAFGVKYKGQNVLNFGDLSILSFHATKIFNTFEGGAIVSHDKATKKQIDYLKNFGFAGETKIIAHGINAKMNEFQAAMGLLQLKHIKKIIRKRKTISDFYRDSLKDIPGIHYMTRMEDVDYNYSYFPVFVDVNLYGVSRDALYEYLKEQNIFCRRYFYPLIPSFPMYSGLSSSTYENLPIAYQMADQVLCLPIYPDLHLETVKKIVHLIKKHAKH